MQGKSSTHLSTYILYGRTVAASTKDYNRDVCEERLMFVSESFNALDHSLNGCLCWVP